jgi:hypothetical protein
LKFLLGAISVCLVGLSACGGDAEVSTEASYFDGLDPDVVVEVLNDPVAAQKIDEEPEETQPSMAQGLVRNYVICREAFGAYRQWTTTGEVPKLAPIPSPDNPEEPSNETTERDYSSVKAAIESGEPQQLRSRLTAEGGCGQWIPAEPDGREGPTIKEAIEESA